MPTGGGPIAALEGSIRNPTAFHRSGVIMSEKEVPTAAADPRSRESERAYEAPSIAELGDLAELTSYTVSVRA